MTGPRLTEQLSLAFTPVDDEPSPPTTVEGAEPVVTTEAPERPVVNHSLMEAICERENLERALRRVEANKGSPGADGMTVDELPDYLRAHWPQYRAELMSGTYVPSPVKRVEIPETRRGRAQVGRSHRARPVHPAGGAPRCCNRRSTRPSPTTATASGRAGPPTRRWRRRKPHLASGYRWVVDLDLEKFFDRVNHDLLMGRLAARVRDNRVLRLVRGFLTAGVLEGGLVSATEKGTPQGGPLSPLLSNIVLDALDGELERRGHRFVRYADDFNVYVRSARAGQRVMANLTAFITRRLKLQVNMAKSAVVPARALSFLGFGFTDRSRPKRRLAASTVLRFRKRVRMLTRRVRGVSLRQMVRDLSAYLLGWRAYFGYCQTPTVLRRLDAWIRRRLRAVVWKQWQRTGTRFRELRKRGVNAKDAILTARSNRGPWRVTRTAALCWALPGAYFASLGLPHLEWP